MTAHEIESNERLFSGGRRKTEPRRSRVAYARIALLYSLVAIMYSVSFLSSTSFLQVEVATAFAFKLPKPPRIVKNLISFGRPDDDQIAPIIQDWSLNKQLSKDGVRYSLIGTVTGHPAIPDGDAVSTAPLEASYVDIANKLLLKSRGNVSPKFIVRGQSSKYTELVATVSGTKYLLLPPNIKISDAPLLSRGREGPGAGEITGSLSYKNKLSYLEEQIEVVRLLAEQEDEIEREKQKSAAIIRDAGIIVATALAGAAYIGDNVDINTVTTEPTVVVNRIEDSKTDVKTSTETNTNGAGIGVEAKSQPTSDEIVIAQPAKAILPYLEERIKALEEEQQKLVQRQSKNEVNEKIKREESKDQFQSESKDDSKKFKIGGAREEKPKSSDAEIESDVESRSSSTITETSESESKQSSTSKALSKLLTDMKESIKQADSESDNVANGLVEGDTTEATANEKQVQSETSIVGEDSKPAKASFQEGMTKLLTDVKESIKQPDPESDSVENQVVGADTQKNTKKGEGIESNQQQTKSDIDDEGTKASPVIEGVAKIFSDIKESIKQPDSEADTGNDVVDADSNDNTVDAKGTGLNVPDAQTQSQPAQIQDNQVVEKIEKIAQELSSIQEDASTEIRSAVSDLAWAGKQLLGDAVAGSDDGATNSDKNIDTLASSALSTFGEDGVKLLSQNSFDAMKTVSDALSLEQIWTELMEVASKMELPEDLSLSKSYKDYNFDEKTSIELVAGATLVAVVGTTTAVAVKSRMFPDESEWSDDTSYWYDNSYDMNQFDSGNNGWGAETDDYYAANGAGMGYDENDAESPFPFATSSWGDQSNTYDESEYSMGWTDASSLYEDNEYGGEMDYGWAQQDGGYNYDAQKPYFGAYDQSTTSFENLESEINDDGQFSNGIKNETPDQENDPSSMSMTKQGETDSTKASEVQSSPFGTASNLPKGGQENKAKASFSPFGNKPPVPKSSQDDDISKDDFNTPKADFSPFNGSSSLSSNGQKLDVNMGVKKTRVPPFGSSSALPKTEEEKKNSSNSPGTRTPPFGSSSAIPEAGQEGSTPTTFPKKSFSPFGSSPKKSVSPFGSPSKIPSNEQESGTSATFPKKNDSPFGSSPKTSVSPFGSPSKIPSNEQGSDTSTTFPKKSFSPFGSASTIPKAGQESGMPSTYPKKNESLFGSSSKASVSPFGATPAIPANEQGSDASKTSPKKTFSPFDSASATPKAGQDSGTPSTFPKKSVSPFGSASPPSNQQESGSSTSFAKKSVSPFGSASAIPKAGQDSGTPSTFPKKSVSPFGSASPPSNQQGSDASKTSPKKTFSPFGSASATPKAGQDSGTPSTFPKKSVSPFGSASPPPNQQESKERSDETLPPV